MKLSLKNFLPLLVIATLMVGACKALTPTSEPMARPVPTLSVISSVSQNRLDPITLLTIAAPGGMVAKADQYVLAALQDYFFTTDASGQHNLVVAIAYTPAVPGQEVPEIPPFLAHDALQQPTMLFVDGHRSVASGATHFPCSLVGFSTPMLLRYASAGRTCPERTEIQTILLVFPVQQESKTLDLLLDGGKYHLILS